MATSGTLSSPEGVRPRSHIRPKRSPEVGADNKKCRENRALVARMGRWSSLAASCIIFYDLLALSREFTR